MTPSTFWLAAMMAMCGGACSTGAKDSDVRDGSSGDGPIGCTVDEPPGISLKSSGLTEEGIQGSFCASSPTPGCGHACVDRGPSVSRFMVVHPGDELSFVVEAGALVETKSCSSSCLPHLRVVSELCTPPFDESRPLDQALKWAVDLSPGVYSIWVDSSFQAANGGSGSLYVGFGLLVDAGRPKAVLMRSTVETSCREDGGIADAG